MAQGQNINPALAPFVVPVGSLHLDPKNRRKHNDKNLRAVAASLEQLGQQKPIVVDDAGKIIAGNGTYQAAVSLGWAEIAAVQTNLLDEKQRAAFGLADNRTAELATWDFEGLSEDAKDGVDFIGWDAHELEPLLEASWDPPEVDGGAQASTASNAPGSAQGASSATGAGSGAAGAPGAPVAREGELFGAFTESEQSWVLKALQMVRDQSDEVTSNEQALARVCKEYVEAFES